MPPEFENRLMSRAYQLPRPSTARPAPRPTARVAALALAAAALSAAAATGAAAQGPSLGGAPTASPRGLEFRPLVGAFVPTGDQRDLLDDAVLTGAQLGYRFTPNLALTGSFGWAPSADKTGAGRLVGGRPAGAQDVDLFQYDLAVEGRLPAALTLGAGRAWHVSPFAALGAGARTFNYRDLDGADAQTQFTGLGALGVDVGPADGRVGLRLEARDYVSAFKGLRGERADRTARNDLSFAAGLTVSFGRNGGALGQSADRAP
jgi:hypothetical protein